jgi:hypothetical protein
MPKCAIFQFCSAKYSCGIELLNAGQIELGMAAHHWLRQGTNSGNEFSFKGASIIHEAV